MKRMSKWLAVLLVFTLLAGCGDSSNFIKENYSLIDVQGNGKSTAKIYAVQDKDVPTVARELAKQEKPKETSKESAERMFLVYDNKIIHVQKDPDNENSTLVELDSVQYAKDNYDSSFLQGYVTATLLQSLFGGAWTGSNRGTDYRGYTSSKRYEDFGKYQSAPSPGSAASPSKTPAQQPPTTSDRKGSFTTSPTTPSKPSTDTGSSVRRNDGSKPSIKVPSSGSSKKPSTSKRSGSFKRR
ncbi:DUF4247 domain-containing protein [Paenibacillus puerhi]|uniref:DUF4247 domain-containing protein n=1 Tax=Paenibacillus puerhi TaxID=2692622 RepID=UPI001356C1DA|nr:DUF4247 domain-containing protein [Paenibacillus puerhi]